MKRIPVLVFTALAALLVVSSPSYAILIHFVPSSTTVDPGDLFDIDVRVSGLGTEIVSAYDLDVSYDPTIVSATGVAFGSFLTAPSPDESLTSFLLTPGNVNFAEVSFLSDDDLAAQQPASFILATISFVAVAPGTTALTFEPSPFFEVIDLKGRNNQILDVESQPGEVTVRQTQAAPEPGTLLLGLGFLGLLAVRRRFGP
jgi:hypothetical protein